MSLVSIPGGLWIPDIPGLSGGPTFSALTAMSAAGHKEAVAVFEVAKTGSITAVGFLTGTVTVSDSVTVGIYTIDASGNATATAYGGMVGGVQASVASNTPYSVTLGTPCSATAGDVVAIVLSFTSYVAGNFQCNGLGGSADARSSLPYTNNYNGTTWAKGRPWPVAWVSYGGTYYYLAHVFPITAISSLSFNLNTAVTDEYSLTFTLAFACRVAGAMAWVSGSGAFELTLYSGTTALQTYAINPAQSGANAGPSYFTFPTPQVLAAATLYRLAIRPTTATSVTLQAFTLASAAAQDQMGGGQNFLLGKRLDLGAWLTDVTTQRPVMALLIDQVDSGAGGAAGMLFIPNLDGM